MIIHLKFALHEANNDLRHARALYAEGGIYKAEVKKREHIVFILESTISKIEKARS